MIVERWLSLLCWCSWHIQQPEKRLCVSWRMLRAHKGHGARPWTCLVTLAMFLVQYPAVRIRLVFLSHTASVLPFLTPGIKRIHLLYLKETIHSPEGGNITLKKKIWVHIFPVHSLSLSGTRAPTPNHRVGGLPPLLEDSGTSQLILL